MVKVEKVGKIDVDALLGEIGAELKAICDAHIRQLDSVQNIADHHRKTADALDDANRRFRAEIDALQASKNGE